jgi:hypothetical protein
VLLIAIAGLVFARLRDIPPTGAAAPGGEPGQAADASEEASPAPAA